MTDRRSIRGEFFEHISIPIREALANDDAALCYVLATDDQPLTAAALRTELVIQLAKGHRLTPLGACSNFDPQHGCRGHRTDRIFGGLDL
jgi:hypothetical protein